MRINAITTNYAERKDYNKNIVKNNIQNYHKNSNCRDVVSFSGKPDAEVLVKIIKPEDLKLYGPVNELFEKGIGYKGQILEHINQVRVNISDILRENGLYPNSIFSYLKQGSKTAQRLDNIVSRGALTEKGECMCEASDIITLPSKKHPDVKLKINRESEYSYAWSDGHYAPTEFMYEDKKFKLNSPHAYFTTDDGTRLYFGFSFPDIGESPKLKTLFDKEIKTLSSERPYFLSLDKDSRLYHIYDQNNNIDYAFKYEDGKDDLVGIRLIKTREKFIFKPDGNETSTKSGYFTADRMYSYRPGDVRLKRKFL